MDEVCCVGSVQIQIKIIKLHRCIADIESKVKRFERRPFVRQKPQRACLKLRLHTAINQADFVS